MARLPQDVLRRWYSAHPTVVANVKALVANAAAMEAALLAGDVPAVGRCLDAYWEQKKVGAHTRTHAALSRTQSHSAAPSRTQPYSVARTPPARPDN